MIKVALFPRHVTSLYKMLGIAKHLPEDFRCVALIVSDELLYKDVRKLEKNNIAWVGGDDIWDEVNLRIGWLFRCMQKLKNQIFLYLTMRRRLMIEYKIFRRLLEQEQPNILLAPGDREMTPVPPMLRAAKDIGIPIVNCAFGSPYPEGVKLSRRGKQEFDLGSFPNRFVANRYQAQVLEETMFSPAWLTLAHAHCGMLSDNPWVQGGGQSDYLLTNDAARHRAHIDMGVQSEKLILTGDPSLDILYREWRKKPKKSNVAIFSFPNDPESGLGTVAQHWERMRTYVNILAMSSYTPIVVFHPKTNPDDYFDLFPECFVVPENLALEDILPSADLFICSGSSTILWARLCDVPVINMDYWNARDNEAELPGVVTVCDPEEFRAALISPPPAADGTTLRIENKFDGRASERIADLFRRISSADLTSAAAVP